MIHLQTAAGKLVRLTAIVIAFCITALFLSCGKHDDNPNPPVTNTDSLTAGWSAAKTPDTNTVIDIAFANNTTGYAVTTNHEVWKSTDGGFNWLVAAQLPDSFSNNNIAVTKDGKVFIAPGNPTYGIFKSVDGSHFIYQSTGFIRIAAGGDPDIVFSSNDTGYVSSAVDRASGDATGLWQTTDGGNNWHFVSTGAEYPSFHNLAFYGASGYITNGNALFYTAGRYNQWDTTVSFPSRVTSVSAVSAAVAYAAVGGGYIYKTTNAGVSFSIAGSIPQTRSYLSLRFPDEQHGFLSSGHQFFQSSDGGVTWKQTMNLPTINLVETYATDNTHSWVCGDHGAIFVYKP